MKKKIVESELMRTMEVLTQIDFLIKIFSIPSHTRPLRIAKKTFPFLLLLCVSFTNEIEKLCLITGIYIRHCSSFFLPHPPLRSPLRRAFFRTKAFSLSPRPGPERRRTTKESFCTNTPLIPRCLCIYALNYKTTEIPNR